MIPAPPVRPARPVTLQFSRGQIPATPGAACTSHDPDLWFSDSPQRHRPGQGHLPRMRGPAAVPGRRHAAPRDLRHLGRHRPQPRPPAGGRGVTQNPTGPLAHSRLTRARPPARALPASTNPKGTRR